MTLKTLGSRVCRDVVRQTINSIKSKIVTHTTRAVLDQFPKAKNPLVKRAANSMTRHTIRMIVDMFWGYTKGEIKTKKQPSKKAKLILFFALLIATPTLAKEVRIITPQKSITVTAEVADDKKEQAKGLMFRKELPENAGMIFIFNTVQPRTFWMKNTYIPLDILFFDEKGIIVHIAQNTKPLDETYILSQKPAKGALEVNAGFTEKYQITIGDKIVF